MSITVQEASTAIEKLFAGKTKFADITSQYGAIELAHAHSRSNASTIQTAYNATVKSEKAVVAGAIDFPTLLAAIISTLSSLPIFANNPELSLLLESGLSLLSYLIPAI